MPFIFDTSSFRVLSNFYQSRFPTFWSMFDQALQDGSVLSVREVYNELEHQLHSSWLWAWLRNNRGIFLIPSAAETRVVAEIFAVPHFRTLVGEAQRLRGQPVADPFVIACARTHGGPVVSEEARKPNAAKIPNVCDHFGVDCIGLMVFMERNGWQF